MTTRASLAASIRGGVGRSTLTDASPSEAEDTARVEVFDRFLAVQQACWGLTTLARRETLRDVDAWTLLGVGALVVAMALPRSSCHALRALGSALLVAASWPTTSNHGLLGSLLCFVLPVLIAEPKVAVWFLQRTLLAIGFGAGVQKGLHGTWWSGSFLAYQVAHTSRFADAFGWLVEPETRQVLAGFRGGALGEGPYRLTGAALAVSRALLAFEVGLPVLALVPRVRPFAYAGLGMLGVSFALIAREVLFGGLFLALTALVLPAGRLASTLRAIQVGYVAGAALWLATGGAPWS